METINLPARKKKQAEGKKSEEESQRDDSPESSASLIPFRKHPVLLVASGLLLAAWFALMLWVASKN